VGCAYDLGFREWLRVYRERSNTPDHVRLSVVLMLGVTNKGANIASWGQDAMTGETPASRGMGIERLDLTLETHNVIGDR
jgi:hypothetical protein